MKNKDEIKQECEMKSGKNHFCHMDRRTFVKLAGAGAGVLAFGGLSGKLIEPTSASFLVPQVPLPGKNIPKYVDPLPVFGPAGLIPRFGGTSLSASMIPHTQQILPAAFYAALPAPYNTGTSVWAYQISDGVNTIVNYPAVTIEAQRNTTTTVTYANNLTSDLYRLLTVDQTLHWADPLMQMNQMLMTPYTGPVPAVAHLHGGEVPAKFDGGPDAWWTPAGQQGHAYVTNIYDYPNTQEATTLWFHDHALGVTRLNVYSGLAGFYLLRDAFDTGLPGNPLGLPAGPQEIEIVIQDRMFDTFGRLFFPDIGINPLVHPFWIPEFFGDTIVVNGKTWPFLSVEPRRYRFRLLNGSNARFYNLSIPIGKGKNNFLPFYVIGNDGGLLDAPLMTNQLLIAPGERVDIIVDFTPAAGQNLTMTNSARAPFPAGAPPDPQTVAEIMQFRVGPGPLPPPGDTSFDPALGGTLRGGAGQPPLMVQLPKNHIPPFPVGVTARRLTLNEVMGAGGPLEVLLNNTNWAGKRPDGTPIPGSTPIPAVNPTNYYTELPNEGQTEVWEIVNLTADTHPIHLHLVQFQLINRQAFKTNQYLKAYNAAFPGGALIPAYGPPAPYNTPVAGFVGGNPDVTPYLTGAPMLPGPGESGWKDTVQMNPGEVTRIVVRFAPTDKLLTDPNLYYPFNPDSGHGYVWHCHLIDHEDNEMMRPYSVTPNPNAPPRP